MPKVKRRKDDYFKLNYLYQGREDDLESGPTMFSMLSSIGNCDAVFTMKGLCLEEWVSKRTGSSVELTHEEFLASKPHIAEYINKQNSLIRFFRNGIRLGLYFNLSQFERTTGNQWEEPDERGFRRRYLKLLASLSKGKKNYAF